MLKPFLLVSAVALFVVAPSTSICLGPGCRHKDQGDRRTPPAKAKLYAIDCALCHGASGNGEPDLAKDMQLTMIDWTDSRSLAGLQDQELFKTIRNGKGKMQAEDTGRAKDDEVWNLVVYIRAMGKNVPAGSATRRCSYATDERDTRAEQ